MKCTECGAWFVSKYANAKFCSVGCKAERNRRRHRELAARRYVKRERDLGHAHCGQCGVEFKKYHATHIYCSRRCQWNANGAKKRPARQCVKCGADVDRKPGIPVCPSCKADKRDRTAYERRRTLSRYGLTAEEFDRMLHAQGGKCPICKTSTPGAKGWCVDHCHTTQVVRGLLCSPCNSAIGLLREDPANLMAAIDYLATPRQLRLVS